MNKFSYKKIKFLLRAVIVLLLGYSFSSLCYAQPQRKLIEVIVTPVKTNWTYTLNEQANFEIKVLKNGQLLPDTKVFYEIGPEQMPPFKQGEITLYTGIDTITGSTMDEPGFIRCEADVEFNGQTYTGWGTAGFEPDRISPVVEFPGDFDQFWSEAKKELSEIPMDAKMTLIPEDCTAKIDVFHVNLQNINVQSWYGNSRFYGILSVPKSPGDYPAILAVPGAGVRPYSRDDRAANGVILFRVGIHGVPVNMPPEVYTDLGKAALSQYPTNRLDEKDLYYYRRVYLGCVRAIDFIFSLTQFDGENLAVSGGSQGGALSIITAGLDNRVKYLAAFFPALCDLTGYLEGRAGGWPHMFKEYDPEQHPNWTNVAPYYDVVNFAKRVNVPGWYSWGFNDNVCPPTSMYAAYNSIQAPKELHTYLETGHWTFPEQREAANMWLYKKLGIEQVE